MLLFRKGDRLVGKVNIRMKTPYDMFKDVDRLVDEVKEEVKKAFIAELASDLRFRVEEEMKQKLAKEMLESFDAREALDKFYITRIKNFMDYNAG